MKRKLIGIVDPQSSSSNNQASIDGTSDEKEEPVWMIPVMRKKKEEALDPQSCSSNNRISMDGIDDEKEGLIWMVQTMRKRKWKRLMDPSSPYYKMFCY